MLYSMLVASGMFFLIYYIFYALMGKPCLMDGIPDLFIIKRDYAMDIMAFFSSVLSEKAGYQNKDDIRLFMERQYLLLSVVY